MLFEIKMREKNVSNIVILNLTPELAIGLEKYSSDLDSDLFKQGFFYNLLKSLHYFPHSNKIVAFDKENRVSIGFLSMKENTDYFLIEDVFVNENYRNMGVASKLLTSAIDLAIKKGAKKISLNVYEENTNAINLYKKHNFEEIGHTIMGQGDLLRLASPLRLVRRVFIGHKFLSKLLLKNNKLIELNMESQKTKETLFKICSDCISPEWIDFFEINANNLKNGSKRVWQPSVYTNVLANDLLNSYIIVFSYPFSHKASVELYSNTEATIPQMLDSLLGYLLNRGISFVRITSFNLSLKVEDWYKEKKMMTFHFLTMGKKLK